MSYVLVDFDTHLGRGFEVQRPIGVWVTLDPFGVAFHYRTEVEEGEDPGYENYMRTFRALEGPLQAWRAGEEIQFATWLEYVSETTYLGTAFRTFGFLEDPITIDEAFRRFVLDEEPLPDSEVTLDVG